MSFTRIQVSNFRCIQELDLELPPFTVVIGPNGAGKTTLLDCFGLFTQIANQQLVQTFSRYGGFDAALCWHSDQSHIKLALTTDTDQALLDYAIVLQKQGNSYYVSSEEVLREPAPTIPEDKRKQVHLLPTDLTNGTMSHPEKGVGPGHLLRTSPTGYQWVAGDQVRSKKPPKQTEALVTPFGAPNPEISSMLDSFKGISRCNGVDLLLDQIRRPQALEPSELPARNGNNLLSVLYGLKTEKRDCYKELIESLQVAFPELESIELPLAGKGFASLNWFQKGLDRPFDAQQLSDGTLRLLWLVTLLFTVPDDGLVLIDEPEISMHPQWLMFLVSLMRQTSARTQIIVATHSDQLIRWLEPHELLVADLEDGVSRFRWGSEMDLDEWLKKYTLDKLWLMGELGGRR